MDSENNHAIPQQCVEKLSKSFMKDDLIIGVEDIAPYREYFLPDSSSAYQ